MTLVITAEMFRPSTYPLSQIPGQVIFELGAAITVPHPGCALFDEKNLNAATANGKELIKGCRFHSCAYELTFLSDGVQVKVGPDGDTMFRLQAGNVAPDVTPELKKLTLE